MPKRHTNAVFLGDLRGRTAGKLVHLERIAADVAAALAGTRCDLEALDRIIKLYDPRIDPTALPLILSNKKIPRGARGGLSVAIRNIMEKVGPAGLSTREVGWALQLKNGLTFETPREFQRFLRNAVRERLDNLERLELLESFEDLTATEGGRLSIKRWRVKKAGTSIESLVADAKACGAEVIVVDAECQLPAGTNPPG